MVYSVIRIPVLVAVFFVIAGTASGGPTNEVAPCDVFPMIDSQHDQMRSQFGLSNDVDADGLPDSASLALIEAVDCLDAGSAVHGATRDAFNINLASVDAETDPDAADFREAIAALMMVSQSMQEALGSALVDNGISLLENYEVVVCSGGTCVPAPVKGVPLTEAYAVFTAGTKAADEPYSAEGDLDEDGVNNVTEFDNVSARGGRTSDFVVAATSPNLDGTEPIRDPGGGGGGACFVVTAAYGTPLAGRIQPLREIRDDVLLTSLPGTVFTDTYYRLGGRLAGFVSVSPLLQNFVRAVVGGVLFTASSPILVLTGLGGAVAGLQWTRGRGGHWARPFTFPGRRPRRARGQ